MTTLLTTGTFDTPHMGHAAFLRQCERFADEVIVGVLTDDFVESYKGARPLFNVQERIELIHALGYSAKPCPDQAEMILDIQPDVIAVGSDWHGGERYLKQLGVDQEFIDGLEIAMVYIPYTRGMSTSILKDRLCGH